MQVRVLDSSAAVRGAIRSHGRAWQEAYAGILPASVLDRVTVDPDESDIREWLDRLPGEDDPGVAYGASVDRTVRGYIYVRWGDTKPFVRAGEAGLKELYVHPEWWGAGLGTSLLGRAVDAVPSAVDGLALEALAGNEIGSSFYESRGFGRDGRGDIELAGTRHETVIYRRPLDRH